MEKRKGDNDTADAGFTEFLRWVSIIEQVEVEAPKEKQTDTIKKLIQLILQGNDYDFPYKSIKFDTIYNYWKALEWIADKSELAFDEGKDNDKDSFLSPKNKMITQNECFVLLPVLKFVCNNIETIETDATVQRNARRIYEFFKNIIRIEKVKKAVISLVGEAIRIIDLLIDGDIVSILDISDNKKEVSAQILTNEETLKLRILKDASNREETEEALWSAQKHKIWSGEILPLVEWATDENGNFRLDKFIEYKDKFKEVFYGNCDSNIDEVRRALLTIGLKDYPRHFKGYTNLSFCWDWSDWKQLINDNKDSFKGFFDRLISGETLQSMIEAYAGNEWHTFVKNPELLAYCEKKNIQKCNNSYYLIKKGDARLKAELETFLLYREYSSGNISFNSQDGIVFKDWMVSFYEHVNSALVFDKTFGEYQVAIDVHYYGRKENDWDIHLFLRNKKEVKAVLESVATKNGLSYDENLDCYVVLDLSREEVKKKIEKLIAIKDNFYLEQ